MKDIKEFFVMVLALIGAVAYRLCVPATLVLIACKIWYKPYIWGWVSTIIVPMGCGAIGFIICVLVKIWIRE